MTKSLLRIILSPIIFLASFGLLLIGLLFPISFLIMVSLYGLISHPLIWLFRKAGVTIDYTDPFIDTVQPIWLGHFLGITINIWCPFYTAYMFIKKGEIIFNE